MKKLRQEEARLPMIDSEDLRAILEAQEERQRQMLKAVLETANQQQQALLEQESFSHVYRGIIYAQPGKWSGNK
ncbi:hypothetical protein Tcan_06174 [Toxocara canis]|uniref:Uncharacterized protein n=1 Tax=Toxocara canis TaxID=6265 RepID=A0A0B2VDK7_TOXCA|nr:hypothetical protein Tcan_06174 [Toxocara canis]